ncbi:MAG: glutamyl-tRNA amidotransferase subunit [Acidimicrobiaceae bacterium]|nr:glutamyl-tRNA amidotransferase subunit [Acidimicrobiaceae bacterium]
MSGEISVEEVAHVAHLARLELDPDELARYAEQLSAVLEHVEAVRRLDTAEVPPTSHALELRNVLRPDEIRASLSPEEVLACAPAVESGRFKVPRILGEAP